MTRIAGFGFAIALCVLGGCSVNEVISAEETELLVASAPKDESQLLDIGIIEFDDGVPEDNDPEESNITGPYAAPSHVIWRIT